LKEDERTEVTLNLSAKVTYGIGIPLENYDDNYEKVMLDDDSKEFDLGQIKSGVWKTKACYTGYPTLVYSALCAEEGDKLYKQMSKQVSSKLRKNTDRFTIDQSCTMSSQDSYNWMESHLERYNNRVREFLEATLKNKGFKKL